MDWLLTDGDGIFTFWMLVFAGCNVLRGAYCLVIRDRRDRRAVGEVITGGLHPVRASFLLGGTDSAAMTAVCALADDGVLRVSADGGLRHTHRGRPQTSPALKELSEELRRTPRGETTKLYEIRESFRFDRFRMLVAAESPSVRTKASGRSQTLMMVAATVIALGMGFHAGPANASVPFLPEADRTVWLYVCMGFWFAGSGVAALWPSERRRRWKALDAYCRGRQAVPRSALPATTYEAIVRSGVRPPPPPPPAPPTRTPGRTPGRTRNPDGSWSDGVEVDSSCGSCGGCGGD
ncbi:hypothetical protein ACFU9F_03870 [Streptomyces zhihengii]|uniref:hypothetical protein n=1 Tax=Streptomyces zhihengii TaxID=1818004 RepID=UPI0036A8EFEA